MKFWKEVTVNADTSILSTLEIIDKGSLQIALVIDSHNKLLGTVTDGDIRRGILNGISLQSQVSLVMNTQPFTGSVHESRENILQKMKDHRLHQIPIVNDNGCLTGIELFEELVQSKKLHNCVLLMAGGLGTRLSPMTDNCPKPLLKVGIKPILETIIENFIDQGFYRFYLSVNYRADMIRDYFGDGSKWGVEIRYIEESMKLGTAGALSLIGDKPTEPIIVMNGDLLTKVNFQQLLQFHTDNNSKATMCVREYEFQVPYGVVQIDNHRLMNIVEKPKQLFFVNGGIYVLDPEVVKFVPKDSFYDMPNLFEVCIEHKLETTVFPIREYWIDIGQVDDFNRANNEYKERFL
ncbi:UTP--glucose-1-phosphate uridylyltransferase [Paenibacillus allorhizoplanae]|uniref:UTP--glucose-1-phosphate uridylyltransferase n=1 Tax=Paenibacillus allorhizoplanae TaxID=2905648 RepID=A0ABN8GW62_9BACL|nr:nucleotidyltransferase family protein [Paenibacillus allorhizoplanae]CAH1215786.1 UTP--glucose-1-phosphate uridylyltransferase [Paenibacillus allorhizoplanae]